MGRRPISDVPGLYRFGFGWVYSYLLVDDDACAIIDTGLFGETRLLGRLLRRLGRTWPDIKAIILTHGHLDHAGNLHRIKQLTGATVYAHPAEQRHVDGAYPYRGITRICGALEAVGRLAFRYRPAKIDVTVSDGDTLPVWGGLRVVHLPGHTEGHCGYYSDKHDLLFIGDLIASYIGGAHRSPVFLNSVPHLFQQSFRRVTELNPRLILPDHTFTTNARKLRRRFDRYYQRHYGSRSAAIKDANA